MTVITRYRVLAFDACECMRRKRAHWISSTVTTDIYLGLQPSEFQPLQLETVTTGFRPLRGGSRAIGNGRSAVGPLPVVGGYKRMSGEQRSVKTVTTCAREIWVGRQTGQIHTGFLGFSRVVTGKGFEGRRAAGRVVTFITDGRHAGF